MPSNLSGIMSMMAWLPYVITAVVLLIVALVVVPMIRRSAQARALLQSGVPAEATILRIWQTGTMLNNNPEIGLELEVRPAGGLPFRAETRLFAQLIQLAHFQPGATLQVRYDPQDTRKVAVEGVKANAPVPR